MTKDSSSYSQILQTLQNSSLFKELEESKIELILDQMILTSLEKKRIIYSSETVQTFFFILKGRIKISKVNIETGREYIISILESGDIFNVISLLDGEEHDVIIEAIDNIEVLKTPLTTAHEWITLYPEFNKNFLPYLGQYIRQMEKAGSNLALHDTMTRLVDLILHHTNYHEDHVNHERYQLKLINDLSHEVLAQMIGSVRKVVNLHIQELKKEGLINSIRGNLSIKNYHKLLDKKSL